MARCRNLHDKKSEYKVLKEYQKCRIKNEFEIICGQSNEKDGTNQERKALQFIKKAN